MANDVLIPPDLNPVTPENVELVDDATQVFAPTLARGNMQRLSFGDPRWRIMRKYSAVRAEDKARLAMVLNDARGRFATVRTVPGYVQRGSFPSQELLANPTFANGTTSWSAESAWTLSAKDKVLRAARNQSGSTAFFALPATLGGLTAYGIYVARFFIRLGPAFDPLTFVLRIDDYSILAGTNQVFKPLATALVVPRTVNARPGIAQITPVSVLADGAAYIDIPWASFTRCAQVDTGANLITFSDTFSDASWTKARASVGVNTTTAPDGTTTGDSIIEDATAAATHFIQSSGLSVSSAGAEITATAYAKANTRTWCHLAILENTGSQQAGAYFNLTTGAVGQISSSANVTDCRASATSLGSGWWRVSIVVRKTNAATSVQAQLYIAQGDGLALYDGNGVSSIYAWRVGCAPGSAWSVPNQTAGAVDVGAQYKAGYVSVKGLPVSASGVLLAGDYIEINGELKRITAPVNSDGNGNAIVNFRPAMVNPPSNNDLVIVGNPMGRFLASGIKWDSQWGLQEDASMTLDEVYEP